ncbi:hypothetical protein ABT358_02635 [Streptomyces sp. NPDC000341]|uniref:hypothetical protein n=1 Tax=Streptomyces sp. NPDC000341 TaxID=3156645 RepID=UPI00331FE1F2
MTTIETEGLPTETAYGAHIEHTALCGTCKQGHACTEEAELRAASRAERQAATNQCADCGVSGDVAELVARFFPGMSGPGGPAIPLCGTCTRLRADEERRQTEEWANRLPGGRCCE